MRTFSKQMCKWTECPNSLFPHRFNFINSFLANNVCLSKLAFTWNPTVTYIDSIIKTLGVKINLPEGEKCYIGGGKHRVSYIMKCDENEEIKFISADKINACTVEYHFNSKYACQSSGYKLTFSFTSDGSMFTPKSIVITSGLIMFLYCTPPERQP